MRLEGYIRFPHIHGVFAERRAAVRADFRTRIPFFFKEADYLIQNFPDLAEDVRVQLRGDHQPDAHYSVVGEF